MARRTRNESAQKQAIRIMMKSYLNDNEIVFGKIEISQCGS